VPDPLDVARGKRQRQDGRSNLVGIEEPCMSQLAMVLSVILFAFPNAQDSAKDSALLPDTLHAFENLVGEWRAHGFMESDKVRGWDEAPQWGWRFEKGKIVGLEANFRGGKYFTSGTLEPMPASGQYRFLAITPDQKKAAYEGSLVGKKLTLVRQTGGVPAPDQVTIELLHDVRYQMLIEARKSPTSVKKVATIGATRAEVRFGAATKEEQGPKCIITGAPGTSAITYNGQSYFVCCTGCRAEFEHDPEKWLKLAKESKSNRAAARETVPKTADAPETSTPTATAKKSDQDAKSAASLLARAKLLEKNGKSDAAIQTYERLLKEFPKATEAEEAENRLKVLRKGI
jgi:hypothetical protein